MNILRLSAISLLTMMLMPITANAHCDGKHTGNHPHCSGGGSPPPPPPPPACADVFPDFLYEVEATRKALAELHLARTDGCTSGPIAIVPEFRAKAFHMTTNGSKGVILWSEDIENQYIVRRLDFTVDFTNDPKGELKLEGPVTILPLSGEEAEAGDNLFCFSMDIWGDATHESLYMTVLRMRSFNSGPNAGGGTREALIYDLNVLTDLNALPDVREIYN